MIFAANTDGGEEDVGEEAGAGGEGGDSAAVQVVSGVGDQEVNSKRNACYDHKNPEKNSLASKNILIR